MKFKAYHKIEKRIIDIKSINFEEEVVGHDSYGECWKSDISKLSDVILLKSTGLFDSENQEIYEGDILCGETRNDHKQPTFEGVVEWHQPTASFLIRNNKGYSRGLNSLYNPKIKGNIYEN